MHPLVVCAAVLERIQVNFSEKPPVPGKGTGGKGIVGSVELRFDSYQKFVRQIIVRGNRYNGRAVHTGSAYFPGSSHQKDNNKNRDRADQHSSRGLLL